MSLTIEKLKEYPLFTSLPHEQLLLIASCAQIVQKRANQELFRQGDTDSHDIFLLKGAVRVLASDGREYLIQADTSRGRIPLARLRPRQYTAIAQGFVEYFTVPMAVVDEISKKVEDHLDIDFVENEGLHVVDQLYADFQQDLMDGRFVLRSLPETSLRFSSVIKEENISLQQIIDAIKSDPIIAVKIIKSANNPVYWGTEGCHNIAAAVDRLGIATVRKLMANFLSSDIFETSSSVLQQGLTNVWQRSIEIAAISIVLATKAKMFSTEQALLAGLVSTIGEITIIQYAEKYPSLLNDKMAVQRLCETLSAPIGKALLEQWHFPAQIVSVVENYQNWYRNPSSDADLSDLILVATLHSYIGKRHMMALPLIHEIPAFSKLNLGEFTPEKALAVLSQSKHLLNNMRYAVVAE